MKIEKQNLARKLLKDYDVNKDGEIDAKEASLFKKDCDKLFECAYGKDCRQYKNLAKRLKQTTIEFKEMDRLGRTYPAQNDFKHHKYKIFLSPKENSEKLEDCKINLTDMAGIVVHEEEHIQQSQKVYDTVRKVMHKSKSDAKVAAGAALKGDSEVFAEIERMNFYKKLETFSFADKSEAYKAYLKSFDKVGIDPNKDKKAFLEKFDFKTFTETIKKDYKKLDFDDKTDKYGFKNLLFE